MQEINKLVTDLRKAGRDLPRVVEERGTQLAHKGLEVAKESTPVDTGKLKANWKYQKNKKGDTIEHIIYNNSEYAVSQDLGGVTPTGGVYSGNNMTDKGAKEIERNIENAVDNIADFILGGVARGR